MSILNVDKIQPIGGGSTITVDATDIQASTGTITANSYTGVDNTLKVSIGGTEYVRTHSTGQVSIGSTFMWRTDTVAQVYGKSPDLSLSRFNDQFMIAGNETSGAINTGAGIQFFGHDGVQERGMAYIRGLKENGTSGNRASYLAFATRPASGTLEERLRITSGGEVKIADGGFLSVNTNPASTYGVAEVLRIDDGAGVNDRGLQIFEYHHNGARYHRIQFNTNTTTNGSAYTYTQGNYGGSSSIEFDNSGHLSFFTDAQVSNGSTDSITPTERLTIHADGEVAIAAAANGQTVLSCLGAYASSSTVDIQTWARSDSAVKAAMKYSHGTNSMNFGTTTNHPLIFQVNDTERIRIESGGGLKFTGQGTSIPVGGILHHTNNNLYVRGGTNGLVLGNQDNTNTIHISDSNYIKFETNDGTEKVRITSTGRVGIGEASPDNTLHITKDGQNHGIKLERTGTNAGSATINCNSFGALALTAGNNLALYSGASQQIMFNRGAGTEIARFDTSGRLLIGNNANRTINSHTPRLQVQGTDYSTSTVSIINNANDNNGAYLFLAKQRSGSPGGSTVVQNNDIIGQIRFSGADGTDLENRLAYVECRVDGTPGSNDTPGRLAFYTTPDGSGSPIERLRIASTGMVTLGNPTNTTLKAEINNSVGGHYFVSQCDDNQNGFEIYQQHGATNTRAPFAVYDNKTGSKDLSFKIDGAGWAYFNTTYNGTTNGVVDKRYNIGSTNNANVAFQMTTRQRYSIWEHRQIGRSQPRTAQISCGENGSNQGIVYIYSSTANADVTGGVNISNGATSWSATSDMRLKNKTGDILNALEDINKIEPLKFTWKYGPDNNPHVGVSAQSVENVVPEAIERGVDVERQREGDETEYMQVRYTELIPLSIAAIKELKAEVESLKAEIASLKSS